MKSKGRGAVSTILVFGMTRNRAGYLPSQIRDAIISTVIFLTNQNADTCIN